MGLCALHNCSGLCSLDYLTSLSLTVVFVIYSFNNLLSKYETNLLMKELVMVEDVLSQVLIGAVGPSQHILENVHNPVHTWIKYGVQI